MKVDRFRPDEASSGRWASSSISGAGGGCEQDTNGDDAKSAKTHEGSPHIRSAVKQKLHDRINFPFGL